MSYDICRIFADQFPSVSSIRFGFGGNSVPSRPDKHYDKAYLYCDAIILSIKSLEHVYNILYWKKGTVDKPYWEMSLFDQVPQIFRFRTDAYPIRFPVIIKDPFIRATALKLYVLLNGVEDNNSTILSAEDLRPIFCNLTWDGI